MDSRTEDLLNHSSLEDLEVMKNKLLKIIISDVDPSFIYFDRLKYIKIKIKERNDEISNEMFEYKKYRK